MKILVILSIYFSVISAFSNEDVDQLALASLLIKNNNLSRAQSVLMAIKDPQDVQTDRYYLLLGVTAVKQKRYQEAIKYLKEASKSGLEDSDLGEYNETLLRAYVEGKMYKEAKALRSSQKNLLAQRPLYYQLSAQLDFQTNALEEGWSELHKGLRKFPSFFPLKKQKWFYLFENNLLIQSKNYLLSIIKGDEFKPLELAQIAYKYREKKDLKTAAVLGEMALKKAPRNEEIAKELARIYLAQNLSLAAAEVFTKLGETKPNYLAEASELWRKAGYLKRSQRLARLIPDEEKRLKQHLSVALLSKNYQGITSLGALVRRSALGDNEDIQYTLAYAHFMLGEFGSSERYLKNITRGDLLRKSLALRETIQGCEEQEWLCL